MWYKSCLALAAAVAASCGDGAPSRVPDLAAVVTEVADMTPAPDLLPTTDLLPRRCSSPAAVEYLEFLAYTWTQVGGGPPPQYASNSTPVSVQGDGKIVRSRTSPPTPDRLSCTFTESDIDSATCTALCCPGSLLSPVVYVDSRGWSLWTTGSCTFVIGATQYTASVNQISTSFAH